LRLSKNRLESGRKRNLLAPHGDPPVTAKSLTKLILHDAADTERGGLNQFYSIFFVSSPVFAERTP
jgi:hypothetical protein